MLILKAAISHNWDGLHTIVELVVCSYVILLLILFTIFTIFTISTIFTIFTIF